MIGEWKVIVSDAYDGLLGLPSECAQAVVTSPPYWRQRDYKHTMQIGLEPTPSAWVAQLVSVFTEARRVLRPDGVLWLNVGDTYAHRKQGAEREEVRGAGRGPKHRKAGRVFHGRGDYPEGLKEKDLVGCPWRLALALQDDGWWLRSEVIWEKPNPTPSSVEDRPQTAHEHIFLLTKRSTYFFDRDAIREPHDDRAGPPSRFGKGQATGSLKKDPSARKRVSLITPADRGYDPRGRAPRTVWRIPSVPYDGPHTSVFPVTLAARMVRSGSRPGDLVVDPFCGSGTTGIAARAYGRRFIGVELVEATADEARRRISDPTRSMREEADAIAAAAGASVDRSQLALF